MLSTLKTTLLGATLLTSLSLAAAAAPLVTAAIDDAATVAVRGERSSKLSAARDLGMLADTQVLDHVNLVLNRPAERQAALDRLVHDQQDPKSPRFRQWLTPADLRAYGPDEADVAKVVGWLQRHGLTVNRVSPAGMSIDFGGKPSAISAAFHTSIHSVSVSGETHIANMTDLAIPAALAPVVRGATLSNFFPKPNAIKISPKFTVPSNPAYYAVAPADFATIYNLTGLFNGTSQYGVPITGKGITIALVEQTDVLPKDWNTFRKAFKLTGYAGTLKLVHPGGCGDPGFTGDEVEAAIDIDWASAAAPDAAIQEAACPGSSTTFGVETTLQNLVELPTKATVFSISYGGDETSDGLTFLAGWANLMEMGAAEGKSILVSSGDSGSSSDRNGIASTGLGVNGLSTNPYNLTVGGTDFYDAATATVPKYWSATNGDAFSSAKSYVPEIPWNNSCASSVLSKFLKSPSPLANCNTAAALKDQNGVGGTGGQSVFYAKPDWQNIGVPGVPADGVRDQPDISLFAANGLWGHFYVICMSDAAEGGTPCNYNVVNDVFGNAYGGTSVAAPAMAGIIALAEQVKGVPLGNPAPRLYQIAQLQFTNPLLVSRCNSSLGNKISGACVFYDVTAGDNAEPCVKGSVDCFTNAAATMGVGILRSKMSPHANAFPATPGYDLATGLGTVNAANLLYNY